MELSCSRQLSVRKPKAFPAMLMSSVMYKRASWFPADPLSHRELDICNVLLFRDFWFSSSHNSVWLPISNDGNVCTRSWVDNADRFGEKLGTFESEDETKAATCRRRLVDIEFIKRETEARPKSKNDRAKHKVRVHAGGLEQNVMLSTQTVQNLQSLCAHFASKFIASQLWRLGI